MSSSSTNSLTWKTCLPFVLRAAGGREQVNHDDLGAAVETAAIELWPAAVGERRGGMTLARFHAAKTARRAVFLGFFERIRPGVFRLSPAGESWLENHSGPLNSSELKQLGQQLARARNFGFEIDEPEKFFWVIRTGSRGEREEASLRDNAVYPGMDYGDDANQEFDRESLLKKIAAFDPALKKLGVSSAANQLNRFRSHMELGDLVLMPSKLKHNIVYVGRVSGDYEYRADDPDPQMRHMVPIDWRDEPIERSDLGVDILNSMGSLLTLCRVSKNNALERVESVIAGNGDFEMSKYNDSEEDRGKELGLTWVPFFTELADKLLDYRNDRTLLLEKLREESWVCERQGPT